MDGGERQDKGNYLALHKVDDKYFLTKTKVTYIPLNDYEGEEVGNNTSNLSNVVAYIRDKNITSGEVTAAIVDWSGKSGKPRVTESKMKITLGNQTYFVYDTKGALALTRDGVNQEISPGRVSFAILWAGDLDGDGKLDLIIYSLDGDDKNSEKCLLLSSIAKKPQLVKEAACMSYGG